MIVKLQKIGNSKGLIIPKNIIEMCDLKDEVDLTYLEGQVIISAPKLARSHWEEQFELSGSKTAPSEQALADGLPNLFDQEEWTW